MSSSIEKIAVIGTGVIGSGWILRFLSNNKEVWNFDPNSSQKKFLLSEIKRTTKTLKKLLDRIQKLENENSNYLPLIMTKDGKTLKKLAEEVAALEKKIPSFSGDNQNSEARMLVLSIGQLRESARAGRSFESELAALKVLVEGNKNINTTTTNI